MKTKNFGIISSLALDPIEKKPLYHFFPGSSILSVGSFGCNMRCQFCQNHEIAHPNADLPYRFIPPKELFELALSYQDKGNIGVAFTYNEPLITYDYVVETGKMLMDAGLKTVVVSNGCFGDKVIDKILPITDAMNIDIKGFTDDIYKSLGGNLNTVKNFVEKTYKHTHIELTSLIVPGLNDKEEDMEKQAIWIASLNPDIPLHITRFFPRYKILDKEATDIRLMQRLATIAREFLNHVYLGNV